MNKIISTFPYVWKYLQNKITCNKINNWKIMQNMFLKYIQFNIIFFIKILLYIIMKDT
jgi:hypothetical protein